MTSLRDAAGRLAFVTNIESPVGGANQCGGALVSPSMDHPGQPGVSCAQVTASDSRCPRAPEGVPSRVHPLCFPRQAIGALNPLVSLGWGNIYPSLVELLSEDS